jgi:ribonuclease BN (tRNA processing enzyme)
MQVTVLGKSPSWQDGGGACSGYLVQEAGFTLLLDCGNGVFAKLRERIDYAAVDAVLISHLHADHCFDVIPFSYALTVGPRAGASRPQLHVPPGAGEQLRGLGGWVGDRSLVPGAFAVREYAAERPLAVGPFTIHLREVPHFVPTHAADLAAAGRRFTFGADCRPSEALVELAAGTDLLLAEAAASVPSPPGEGGHLTARQAGEMARAAGAGRLVITHFSDERDPAQVAAEGAAGFGDEVVLAHEGLVVEI